MGNQRARPTCPKKKNQGTVHFPAIWKRMRSICWTAEGPRQLHFLLSLFMNLLCTSGVTIRNLTSFRQFTEPLFLVSSSPWCKPPLCTVSDHMMGARMELAIGGPSSIRRGSRNLRNPKQTFCLASTRSSQRRSCNPSLLRVPP